MDKLDILEEEIKRLLRLEFEGFDEYNEKTLDFDYFKDCLADCLFSILDLLKEIKNANQP